MRLPLLWSNHRRRLVATCCVSVLVSCGGNASARDRILVIGAPRESGELFPPLLSGTTHRAISEQLFEKLAAVGPALGILDDRTFVPRLADTWMWSRDSLSLSMHLNPRARWHDGRPVLPVDVRFALSVYTDSAHPSPSAPDLRAWIDSITTADSAQFTVWFRTRLPENFYNLVSTLVPLPSHVFAGVPRDSLLTSAQVRMPVGSGPYRLVSRDENQRVVIAAVDAFFLGHAGVDTVIWSYSAQPRDILPRLLTGEVDFLESVPPADLPAVEATEGLRLERAAEFDYGFLQLNLRSGASDAPHPVLGNRELRRALSRALDRRLMLNNVFGAFATVSRGPFVRRHWSADSTLQSLSYDTTAAARTLDSLGWRRGASGMRAKSGRPLSFAVLVPAGHAIRKPLAELMQEQFRQAGVDMQIEFLDFPSIIARLRAGTFDAFIQSITAGLSPNGVRQVWTTSGWKGFNFGHYGNRRFDAEIDSAIAAPDGTRGRAHYRLAYQTILDDAPAIWLYERQQRAGVSTRVVTGALRPDAWWATLPQWKIVPQGKASPKSAPRP